MRKVNLKMPWPILIQTGVVALVAPSFVDDFLQWLAVVGVSLLGWLVLFLYLIGLAKKGTTQ